MNTMSQLQSNKGTAEGEYPGTSVNKVYIEHEHSLIAFRYPFGKNLSEINLLLDH